MKGRRDWDVLLQKVGKIRKKDELGWDALLRPPMKSLRKRSQRRSVVGPLLRSRG